MFKPPHVMMGGITVLGDLPAHAVHYRGEIPEAVD